MTADARPQLPPIEAAPRRTRSLASFAQERLSCRARENPDGPTHVVSSLVRLRGELDVDALERSLELIAERHASLRTTFEMEDGVLYQVISDESSVPCPLQDLSRLPQVERDEAPQRQVEEKVRRPFALDEGPPIRVALTRLAPEDHALLIALPQIVADRRSLGILLRELGELYGAFVRGEDSPLEPLPIQYADFAQWQRKLLRGPVQAEQERYWKERLAGELARKTLSGDDPRSGERTHLSAAFELDLDGELRERSEALSRREGSRLETTLLTALKVLLCRCGGRQEALVGSMTANRRPEQTEGLIGFLANTLVLRTDLSGDPSFREALRRVHETESEAQAHQDYPFERLVHVLHAGRDTGRTPIFDVMFDGEHSPASSSRAGGLLLEPWPVEGGLDGCDLAVTVSTGSEGVGIRFEYDRGLFDEATIERMLRSFTELLEGAVADPELPISRLPLLSETGWEALVRGRDDDQVILTPQEPGWRQEPQHEYVAPRSPKESLIAQIWKEVLEVDRVGVHDNFFELGGHSLVASLLMKRVSEECFVELPLRCLFDGPTVAELSAAVETAQREQGLMARAGAEVSSRRYGSPSEASLMPLQSKGDQPPLFLVSGAHAHEDGFLRFVGNLLPFMGQDQPIYGFKARGLDGVHKPHTSAAEMAADYVKEMCQFQPEGPYLLAGNCVGGIVAFEMAQQLRRQGQEVGLIAMLDTTRPMDEYSEFVDDEFRYWKKERFSRHWNALGELSWGGKLGYFYGKLRKKVRSVVPLTESARREVHIQRVEREYSKVLARYRPERYPGKITVIINEELQDWQRDAGWTDYADEVDTRVVPGNHVTRLSSASHAKAMADLLRSSIADAIAGRPPKQELQSVAPHREAVTPAERQT